MIRRSVRFLARLAADPILRADNDRLTAQVKRLGSANLALRLTNGALASQVISKEEGNKTLKRLLEIEKEIGVERLAELARKDAQLTELDELHAEVSARLEQAEEELAGYRTAEAIADETRAKRYYDGQGDE